MVNTSGKGGRPAGSFKPKIEEFMFGYSKGQLDMAKDIYQATFYLITDTKSREMKKMRDLLLEEITRAEKQYRKDLVNVRAEQGYQLRNR